MQRCSACDGFIPASCTACPHCDPSQATIDPAAARAWQRLAMLLRITGGTAVAMTLMACYGAPPGPRPNGPDDEVDPKADKKDGKDAKDPKADEKTKTDAKTPPANDSTDPPTGLAPPE